MFTILRLLIDYRGLLMYITMECCRCVAGYRSSLRIFDPALKSRSPRAPAWALRSFNSIVVADREVPRAVHAQLFRFTLDP